MMIIAVDHDLPLTCTELIEVDQPCGSFRVRIPHRWSVMVI